MRDLRSQIRAYAEHLDAAAPPIEDLDLERPAPSVRPVATPRRRRYVLAAAMAAVVVIGAIGLAALAFDQSQTPVADTTVPPDTTFAPSPGDDAPMGVSLLDDVPVMVSNGEDDPMPFTGPGGVVVDGGTYHMFFTRYGEEGSVIGHGVSEDLVTWEIVDEAVLDSSSVPYIPGPVRPRSAAILPDGRWGLWFDGHSPKDDTGEGPVVIGFATAPGPDGPWTVHPDPVLGAGDPGSRNAHGSAQPSVIVDDGRLVMYFVARDGDFFGTILRATSADGVAWTVDREAVLEAGYDWERGSVTLPNVIHDGERWLMLYANRSGSGQGFAVSDDGVAWEKRSQEAVLTISDVLRASITDTEIIPGPGGDLVILAENGGTRTSTDLVVLVEAS
jgi:hypothetical protein